MISHIVWNDGCIEELWAKIKKTIHLVALTDAVVEEIKYTHKNEFTHFKDRELHKNSRINVEEGQKVSDLFTARGLRNIDILLGGISKLSNRHQQVARFILSSSLGQMSKMVFTIKSRRSGKVNSTSPERKYEVGSWVIGYWRPKIFFEINVWQVFEGRAKRLINSLTESTSDLFTSPPRSAQVNLTCDDAVEYLKKMQAGSVDLLVTDPPHSDRIPYLELSEMWNTFLGYTSKLDNEFIYSNSSKRNKSKTSYLEKFKDVFEQVGRVLKKGSIYILIFNTTQADVWGAIKTFIEHSEHNLKYVGRSTSYQINYHHGLMNGFKNGF